MLSAKHAVQSVQCLFQAGNRIADTGAKSQFMFHDTPCVVSTIVFQSSGYQRGQQDNGISPRGRNADE